MQPFGIGRVEKFDEPRDAPRRRLERQRTAQRLIEVRLLADGIAR